MIDARESWMMSVETIASSRIRDRKSTRLNSSHSQISYAVFCLKKKHILLVLDAVASNKAETARTLSIDRATLYRKLRRLGLDSPTATSHYLGDMSRPERSGLHE